MMFKLALRITLLTLAIGSSILSIGQNLKQEVTPTVMVFHQIHYPNAKRLTWEKVAYNGDVLFEGSFTFEGKTHTTVYGPKGELVRESSEQTTVPKSVRKHLNRMFPEFELIDFFKIRDFENEFVYYIANIRTNRNIEMNLIYDKTYNHVDESKKTYAMGD
jgi:hypothetical protein